MHEPKSIQIIKSLSRSEMKELGRFVDSPFFNRLSDVSKLFKILQKHYPEFKSEQTSNKKIFGKLFPGKPYNDARMRNLYSDLGLLAEKYLKVKSLDEESSYGDYLYLNKILSRKLYNLFEKKSFSIKNVKSKSEFYNTGMKNYLHESVKYEYFLQTGKQHEAGETSYMKYDSLVEFFLHNMVRGLYDFKVYKNMHAFEKENSLMKIFSRCFDYEKFINTVTAGNYGSVSMEISYLVFSLLRGDHFDKVFNLLLQKIDIHGKELTHQFKYDIFLNLINLMAFKTYEDGLNFNEYRLKVLKEIISRKVYHHNDTLLILPPILFITGINLTMELKDFEYFDFLKDNCLNLLPAEAKTDALNYVNANREFIEKNFRSSLEYLSKINYNNIPFRKHVRNLTLLLYYELNFTDTAESLVNSYRQYLNRTRGFIGMYGEWYDNFLKFYSILIKLDLKNYEDVRSFRDKVESTTKLLFKSWMLEKIGV